MENNVLEIEKISKSFGGIKAVQNLTISIKEKKITSIIGPNGAGKTTVLNMISGFITPDSGSIRFRGKEITREKPYNIVHLGVIRTFQDVRVLAKLTVLDNVLLGIQNQLGENPIMAYLRPPTYYKQFNSHLDKVYKILQRVGLLNLKDNLVGTLSYGQQKIVAMARVMATDADTFLLDEPTSGLYYEMIPEMLELISELPRQGKSVCLIEHDMDVVMGLSDWIIVMSMGELLAEGTPNEIKKNSKVSEVYLGNSVH